MVNMRTGLVKNQLWPVVTAIATEGNQFPQVLVRSAHNVIFERLVAVQLLPKQVRKPDTTGLLNSKINGGWFTYKFLLCVCVCNQSSQKLVATGDATVCKQLPPVAVAVLAISEILAISLGPAAFKKGKKLDWTEL